MFKSVDIDVWMIETDSMRLDGNGMEWNVQGALWWIERELHEAKAYLPESKGGYRKAK